MEYTHGVFKPPERTLFYENDNTILAIMET